MRPLPENSPEKSPEYQPEDPTERAPGIHVDKLSLAQCRREPSLHALFDRLEARHPQLGIDWLDILAMHALDPGEEPTVLVARDAAGDAVALPLKLASGEAHALGNFYTSLYAPAASENAGEALWCALFAHLAGAGVGTLTLSPLRDEAALPGTLQSALEHAGWRGVHRYFCTANWTHALGGASWAEYLDSRPSRVKNTVRRRTRQFLADGRGELQLESGGAALEQAIGAFTAIYNSSWKRPEPYPEFIPALLRLAGRRDWLRLAIARYDAAPIAAQAWLVSGGTAHIFKLAYDQEFAGLSPGTVLTAYLLEHVIERDGVTRIDYLSGDDAYKRDWMTERAELLGIAAYNPRTPRGLAGALGHLAKRAVGRMRGG